jgi:type I restriction enzyme M protein
MTFTEAKKKYNELYKNKDFLEKSIVKSSGNDLENISLKDKKGNPSEEYYKWEFIYSLINSGLYSKEYIGVELSFPKGSANSSSLRLDGVIFDSKDWVEKYNNKDKVENLEWLRNHILAVIEFKKSKKEEVKKVYSSQLKPAMNEATKNVLGFYYDEDRLYIFKKENKEEKTLFLRYDESKNAKSDESKVDDLGLELTDSYNIIPSFEELRKRVLKVKIEDKSNRTIEDLEIISGVSSKQINTAMSEILRTLDKNSLVNQIGYNLLIQLLALKIYDENNNSKKLNFFINNIDITKSTESKEIIDFLTRIEKLYDTAKIDYTVILSDKIIDFEDNRHIKSIISIVYNLQDFSFMKSTKTNIYQIVFHRFANAFKRDDKAQFVTPIHIIDFLVNIVNPRSSERITDPTSGIADFLSVSYVNSKSKLNDKNIYGADIDNDMVKLATLNMLLNGDGNAVIKAQDDLGSIKYKFSTNQELKPLNPNLHFNGNWRNRNNLLEFDVVLTNPPFGEDRKWTPKGEDEIELAKCYETYNIFNKGKSNDWIDLGVIFLENAYQILRENGRMGIVLSNSIGSVNRWNEIRSWLFSKMRIVALFDLPSNTFADTGVNTTIIVAYKPPKEELEKLQNENYEIFMRDIKKVGYEVKTIKRVKVYEPSYDIDEETFKIKINEFGEPIQNEELSLTIKDFKYWCNSQEETLREIFVSDK